MANNPFLKAENITKEFPGVKALNRVSLEIESGVATAIIGENGAGKSTLMKILSGVYSDYEGVIYLEDKPIRFRNTTEAQENGIAIIHQELNLIPNLSISENIFLGREPETALGFEDFAKMRRISAELLKRLRLDIDPDTPVYKLKVGQQQLVEIAKVLSLNAQVIIMDEPTSAISQSEIEVLFEIIREFKGEGKAIVYISHKLDELFKITDKYVVLRDGEFVESGDLKAITEDALIRKMVGREINLQRSCSSRCQRETLLAVKGLSLKNPLLPEVFTVQDISFELGKGEVLGLFGLMGAGRTELLELLFGCGASRAGGEIFIKGKSQPINSPREAIENGIALVPEDRKEDGLVLGLDICQNTSLTVWDKISSGGFLDGKKEKDLAKAFISSLKIKASSCTQVVEKLSGGNQQKVVLAKWLATNPEILMLDEPTRGIDINAKNEIYKLIRQLAADGLGLIFVSSELPEILSVADRVLVMAEGKLTANIAITEATSEDEILRAAIPKNK